MSDGSLTACMLLGFGLSDVPETSPTLLESGPEARIKAPCIARAGVAGCFRAI